MLLFQPPLGVEPKTLRLLSACSNQLSYGGIYNIIHVLKVYSDICVMNPTPQDETNCITR